MMNVARHILEGSDADERLMALTVNGAAAHPAKVDELYSRIDSAKRRIDEKIPPITASNGGDHNTPAGVELVLNGANNRDEPSSSLFALPKRKISVAEQGRLDTVTRLRSWLQEVEREASATVDLSDQNIIRQAVNRVQVTCYLIPKRSE